MGIPSQVFTMKVLLLLLLALSDILAEDKNVSPLYNCFVENFTPAKETTNDCFSCLLEGLIQDNLTLLKLCTETFLPTTHTFCSDEDDLNEVEKVEDFLDCLEDSLETMTAKRCLELSHEEEDPVNILKNGALCLLQTQRNATIVVEKFLDLKVENENDEDITELRLLEIDEALSEDCGEDTENEKSAHCIRNREMRDSIENCMKITDDQLITAESLLAVMDCIKGSSV